MRYSGVEGVARLSQLEPEVVGLDECLYVLECAVALLDLSLGQLACPQTNTHKHNQ